MLTGADQRRSASPAHYRGRFAPSPSGPLHFGSLVTATASYLQALSAGGEWLLRIENIDPPREMSGAAERIVRTLSAHGFEWIEPIRYQGSNQGRFSEIIDAMLDAGLAYRCTCSRKQVLAQAKTGKMGPIYPGTCRDRRIEWSTRAFAIRLRTDRETVVFRDRVYGRIECCVSDEIGDFVIRRTDRLIAYSLAVVVDDSDQGITEVVRGDDLLDFTPAQIFLQRRLGFATPGYMHMPVALNVAGKKLSKQTGATPVDDSRAAENLVACLEFLGQQPPAGLNRATPADIWAWARTAWIPRQVVKNG